MTHFGLNKCNVFNTGVSPEFNRLFLQIISELQTSALNFNELTALLLNHLLLLVSRFVDRGAEQSLFRHEIDQAINFFNTNYKKDISIEEYAKKCHVSLSWFIRSFKKYTGITPMQYILTARIANAQSLLESSDYTVSEIASVVGYNNPLYFSRIFKKQTGISPIEYRKTHTN